MRTGLRKLAEWINRNLRWVYLTLVGLCFIGMLILGVYAYNLKNRSDNLTVENKHRIDDIQQERVNNIRNACSATNTRHDNAIEALNLIYANAIKDATEQGRPTEVHRLTASRQATISVINALVPKLDCDREVSKLTPYTGEGS